MNRVLTILDKEWRDVFKNRLVLFTTVFLPLLFVAIPLVMTFVIGRQPIDPRELEEVPALAEHFRELEDAGPQAIMQAAMLQQFNLLFLVLPLAIPMTIATYSIVGEKRERSLEPLLATPITTAELLLGKSLAAAIPGVLSAWLAYTVFLVVVRFLVTDARIMTYFTNPAWMVGVFGLSPLLTVLATTVGLIVSSRVNDPRAAEQLGMFIIVPVLGLFLAQLAGFVFFDLKVALTFGLVLIAVDAALIALGVRLFRRETILTRWK